MQSLLKFNLNGGLKRMVSTLICLMMVLATFPIHMLKDTVCAGGGVPINLTLSSGNGSEVKDWMTTSTGDLADATTVQNAGDINITLSDNIEVASTVEYANLPTMTNSGDKYFFDFTDGRFAGKTITIDGVGKKIEIDNASLFFLNLEDCKVILKNITIDGNSTGRGNSFITVSQPSGGSKSELVIEDGTTIQNCKRSNGGGGAIWNGGMLTMNGVSITNCSSYNGGGIFNDGGMLTMNGVSITNCSSSDGGAIHSVGSGGTVTMNRVSITCCSGGAIYISGGKGLTINDASITNCSSRNGGAIYITDAKVMTINGGSIFDCSASSSGSGGAIYVSGGVEGITINGVSITDCSAGYGGGAIRIESGNTTINAASITGCKAEYGGAILSAEMLTINAASIVGCSATKDGDAICNWGTLNLPPKGFELLTITLPAGHGVGSCTHNDAPDEGRLGYEGIKHAVTENPNRKIVFVDSESGLNLGVAFGKQDDSIAVPDRPGYEFVAGGLSYTKGSEEQGITVTDGKFTLDGDMINSAKNGVVTVKVVYNAAYNKLYTVQYICDNKFVGVKSGCLAWTDLGTVINTDFSKISLDGGKTLGEVVKPGGGCEFSNFTYGRDNTKVVLKGKKVTTWDDLRRSSFDGVITVFLNYTDSGTVKYVASGGHMILDKKSKLTNYSGVNLPIGGLRKVHEPKKVIFDFCGQTIHHNDPNVPFIQGVPGKHIVICNLNMDGSGCK